MSELITLFSEFSSLKLSELSNFIVFEFSNFVGETIIERSSCIKDCRSSVDLKLFDRKLFVRKSEKLFRDFWEDRTWSSANNLLLIEIVPDNLETELVSSKIGMIRLIFDPDRLNFEPDRLSFDPDLLRTSLVERTEMWLSFDPDRLRGRFVTKTCWLKMGIDFFGVAELSRWIWTEIVSSSSSSSSSFTDGVLEPKMSSSSSSKGSKWLFVKTVFLNFLERMLPVSPWEQGGGEGEASPMSGLGWGLIESGDWERFLWGRGGGGDKLRDSLRRK